MAIDLKRNIFWVILGMFFCVHAQEAQVPEVTPEVIREKTPDGTPEVTPEIKPEVTEETPEEKAAKLLATKSGTFYDAYLAKYFPKAMVIREKFTEGMSYDAMVIGLHDSVKLLSDNPRFYIANKEEQVRFTHYWEFVLDQLVLINQFLKKAYVNIEDQKILMIENKYSYLDRYSPEDRKKWLKTHQAFVDYVLDQHPDVLYNFYALMCDYIIKLFNEGILLQDHALANKYYRELEYIVERLGGSSYEFDYQETVKTGKDLLTLLKQKDTAKSIDKFEEKHGRE